MEYFKCKFIGTVKALLIGSSMRGHLSEPYEKLCLSVENGIKFDRHCGPKYIDARDPHLTGFGIIKGTESRNIRQWSAISQEELNEVAKGMGIPAIEHGLIGENLVISGIPDFTKLPVGTQFLFKSPSGEIRSTVLYSVGANNPCVIAGEAIQKAHPDKENLASLFVKASYGKRGLVGFVLVGGIIKQGDKVYVFIPS